jgi:hypothetical protein
MPKRNTRIYKSGGVRGRELTGKEEYTKIRAGGVGGRRKGTRNNERIKS